SLAAARRRPAGGWPRAPALQTRMCRARRGGRCGIWNWCGRGACRPHTSGWYGMTRRVVSLWLPHWPLERRWQSLRRLALMRPGGAGVDAEPREFALVEAGPHGIELAALNEGARTG